MQVTFQAENQVGYVPKEINATTDWQASPESRRDLVCILGLPIDVIDLAGAVARVRGAARKRERCFISTPNLNFLMNAQRDPAFRDSVLRSDLSVADGVSLLMFARMIGIKLPGRVSGADLFAQLCQSHDGPPLKVFFLGGPPGAAQQASDKVNAQAGGVVCVGHDEGGFGDIESMSNQPLIDKINASQTDFVVVALGAAKGQAWITRNWSRLEAPLIAHLGAVVNFTAGTIKRAPLWMQHFGLEWLWRALTEKGLSERYWHDARALLKILSKEVAPRALLRLKSSLWATAVAPAVASSEFNGQGLLRLALTGRWDQSHRPTLAAALRLDDPLVTSVELDLSGMDQMDIHVLGSLLRAHGRLLDRGPQGLQILTCSEPVQRMLSVNEAKYLIRP